jgi:hypothetical protein
MSQGCYLRDSIYRGFTALEMGNDQIQLVVVPGLGGKIAQILHLPSGVQWLWENPNLSYRTPVYGASYDKEFDLGGLDECFPTVGQDYFPVAPWKGIAIPDHGELWSQPWEVTARQASTDEVSLRMACHGVRFPYRFERTLTLRGDAATIHLSYGLTNLSPFDFPFLWSIHPLLKSEAGMQLILPAGVERIRVDFSSDDWLGQMGTLHTWPRTQGDREEVVDLSWLPLVEAKRAVKFFTLPLTGDEQVETGLVDARGERSFRFRFSPSEVTHVGIWMNCGGWTPLGGDPYYNLGLEPCLGGADLLSIAANQWRDAAILAGRATRRWSLDLILT